MAISSQTHGLDFSHTLVFRMNYASHHVMSKGENCHVLLLIRSTMRAFNHYEAVTSITLHITLLSQFSKLVHIHISIQCKNITPQLKHPTLFSLSLYVYSFDKVIKSISFIFKFKENQTKNFDKSVILELILHKHHRWIIMENNKYIHSCSEGLVCL